MEPDRLAMMAEELPSPQPSTLLVLSLLRALRARYDWILQELAERSGVHYVTIHRAEKGSTRITAPVVIALAKTLQVTTDYLPGVDAEPPQENTGSSAEAPRPADASAAGRASGVEECRWSKAQTIRWKGPLGTMQAMWCRAGVAV